MRAPEQSHDRYRIRVVDRAISVLNLLSDGQPRSLTEVHEELGLSSSTAFRLLSSLACHALVTQDPHTGRYCLGLRCLELARAYADNNDLRTVALLELERLRDATGESVHLAVLEGMEVIYLEKLPGLHAVGIMSSRVGGRAPAYCTGLGKVLLAGQPHAAVRKYYAANPMTRHTGTTIVRISTLLDQLGVVARQGYALDQREHEVEVECVASPVLDPDGTVVAAISVSGPADRISRQIAETGLISRTIEAASAISGRLGYHRPSSQTNERLDERRPMRP